MYLAHTSDEGIMCTTKSGNKIYWMLTSEIGAPNFEMRYIEVPPGGRTSFGHHPHEHEVFVIRGEGTIKGPHPDARLVPGTAVFVPGDEDHQFVNASEIEPFGIICIVPKGAESEYKPPCAG